MLSLALIPKENELRGLNGDTRICHGIDRNFGLAIYQIMGEKFFSIVSSFSLILSFFEFFPYCLTFRSCI